MAERQQRKTEESSPEDQAILQALTNQLKDSSSSIALFETFVTHLTLTVDLLKQWERLTHRVDQLERREYDLRNEIGRLEERKQRVERDVYAPR